MIIERTTIGLCISGHEAAEVFSPEKLRHAETNPTCKTHEGYFARHTEIRDQNPSLGYICPGERHQRSPEETEWQEQGAREAAWKLARNVY